ncbi:type II toxin-antitoxin system VapB family antitoxin [Methyloglobulus sp.]|uniref:type II toxin-antitoxin system VapB family antitoxin n=1 Tax=Methyloglobulus sp. TaxID=2518622 RepID=UPI00398994A4
MQQTITINDTLLENASQCVGLEDVNEIINMALHELITNHQAIGKRRQPPVSIAGKGKIIGDLIEPCVDNEDFECLK